MNPDQYEAFMHLCCAVHGEAQPPIGRPVLGAVHAQLALFALPTLVLEVKYGFAR